MIYSLTGIQNKELGLAKILKFILIVLSFGLGSVLYTCIPIVFYRPIKEVDPVSGVITYNSEYKGISSIPMEFNLFGDREIYEVIILTIAYSSRYPAFLILSLYQISPKHAHKWFIWPILATGIVLSGLTIHISLFTIGFAFAVWYSGFSLFYGQLFQYVYSEFEGFLGKYSVFILNSSWSIILLGYIGFAIFFREWRQSIIYLSGYANLIVGVGLILLQTYIERKTKELENQNGRELGQIHMENEKNEEIKEKLMDPQSDCNRNNHDSKEKPNQTAEETSQPPEMTNWQATKALISEVKQNPVFLWNLCVWAICWNVCAACSIGCVLALNKLKGNLFFNLFISTLLEALGNILAIIFIKYFNIKKVILSNFLVIGIAYVSLLAIGSPMNELEKTTEDGGINQSQLHASSLEIFISLFPVLVAKATHETLWNLLVEFQRHILPVKYHQFNFAVGNLFDLIVDSILPYYQFQMLKLKLNQFIGYGVYSLFAAYIGKRKFKMLEESELENGKIEEKRCADNDYEGIHKNNKNIQELQEIIKVTNKNNNCIEQ